MSDYITDLNALTRVAGTLVSSGTQTFENLSATGSVAAGTTVTATTALIGADLSISGLTGSVVATRYVGGTADVAPTTCSGIGLSARRAGCGFAPSPGHRGRGLSLLR